jgi:predicted RNA binding protein YcfA (HicA-like mRNA interferase family)
MPPKFREIRARLLQEGWHIARQRGSHQVCKHPERRSTVVVAGRDGEEARPGMLKSIMKKMGIESI